MKLITIGLGCGIGMGYFKSSRADIFHYNNILSGDRAANLGGTYAGISDDSSGVIYNPGGLGFAASSSLSASVNTFSVNKYTYQGVIGKSDYQESSSDFIPAFVGALKKFKLGYSGIVVAGGVWSSDYETRDQDDLLSNSAPPYNNLDNNIGHFHRVVNSSSKVLNFGLALGKAVTSQFGMGGGIYFQKIDVLSQENQDVAQVVPTNYYQLTAQAKTKGLLYAASTTSYRFKVNALAIGPGVGFQAVFFDKLSVGLSGRALFFAQEKIVARRDSNTFTHFQNGDVLEQSDVEDSDPKKGRILGGVVRATTSPDYGLCRDCNLTSNDLFKQGPTEFRIGFTYFASDTFLLGMDVVHHGAVLTQGAAYGVYSRDQVTNYSLGAEYYLNESFPIRLGLFTNRDTRPPINKNLTSQADHVDLNGATLGLAWMQPLSQVSLSLVHQRGSGQSQKLAGSKIIHPIKVTQWAAQLSSTYSLN